MLNGVRVTYSGLYLVDLLGCDANRSVQRHADAGEQGGEQVALIALDIGEEATGFECAAAFAGKNEWEVFSHVPVAVFQA